MSMFSPVIHVKRNEAQNEIDNRINISLQPIKLCHL